MSAKRRDHGGRAWDAVGDVIERGTAAMIARHLPPEGTSTMSAKRTKGAKPAKPRRSAIGPAASPFTAWQNAGGTAAAKPAAAARAKPLRVSFVIERELLERARAAAYALSGPPPQGEMLTLAGLFNAGVRREVERLERANGGKPYPKAARLKPGRRVGG